MPREVWGSRLPVGSSQMRIGGRIDDGARNRNALLLTARKLIGKLVHLVLKANEAEHLGHLRADDVT